MEIENEHYCVAIDTQNGVILRLFDKVGNLELIAEPRLADNWRLLLPLPDLQANYILGREQKLTSAEQVANGVVLRWDGSLTNPQGSFDLSVTMRIEFVENSIQFRLEVQNRTELQLAEVWNPMLGGIKGIGDRKQTQAMIPIAGHAQNADLFQRFYGGELGIPVPEVIFRYPGNMLMPWVDLYNPRLNRGFYLACYDSVDRLKALRFELQPGIAHGREDNWPRPGEVAEDIPIGVTMNWVSFPYTSPGDVFEGPPVLVEFHDGDWHQAAKTYREWFASHYRIANPQKDWIRQELAFQDIMFMLPEGNVLWTYEDIPRLAKDALDYGVKAFLISGWDRGGHDNQYPYYEPDPRLGTWEQLAQSIQACHKMGVKVFFFVNVQPLDCTTDWYQTELHRYRSMDPWGATVPMGWGMGTLAARLGFTRRPVVFASPSFPELRDIIARQMRKLAEVGADGVHIDKLAWVIVGLDFNPQLKTSPDRASWEGLVLAVEEIVATCRAVNPNFCLSYEGSWDRLMEYMLMVWAWHDPRARDFVSAGKYTFPEWLPALSVSQPFDFNVVNNAVRYGYQLFIGPGHYTTSMQWAPMRPLSAYIKEVLRIWEELKDTLYLGEFLDVEQVNVQADENVRFCTHRNPQTGKRACVLVNFGEVPHQATVTFEGNEGGKVHVYQPFEETKSATLPVTVTIPGERLAIVVEP